VVAGELPRCPPLYIIVGDVEYLRDESSSPVLRLMVVYFAANHAKNGGVVHLQNFRSMPHVFVIFPHPSTQTCYSEMARFIVDVTSGKEIETKMEIVDGKGEVEEKAMDLASYPIELPKPQVAIKTFTNVACCQNGKDCVGAAAAAERVLGNEQRSGLGTFVNGSAG
jgi:hypothetical protein